MRPVMQTRGYDPEAPAGQQRGNCWTACIASLLELPIEDVPDFVQIEVDGGDSWWDQTVQFLTDRGHQLTWVHPGAPGDGFYIQTGLSPRSPAVDGKDVYHAVIYQWGELVHDPHPDQTGLLTTAEAYGVAPISGAV